MSKSEDNNESRRSWVIPMAVVVLLLAFGFGASRLSVSQNVMDLLPADDQQVSDARFVIEHFPASERILISLHGEDTEQLVMSATALSEKLRKTEGISHVQDSVDENAGRVLFIEYQSHLPKLFTPEMQQGFEQLLKPEVVSANMQRSLDAAAGAEGPAAFDQFREDPFGFSQVLLERFERLAGGYQGRLRDGHIVSEDGQLTLIFCEAESSAGDTDKGQELMDALDQAFESLPEGVTAHVVGAHRSSVDNANVVKSDLQWTIAGSAVAILILFLLVFKSLAPVFIAGVSAACGFVSAVGLSGWLGLELTAITLGMAAALLGITVDYSIHLCAAYFNSEDSMDGAKLAIRAKKEVFMPSAIAMVTTVLALLLLLNSNFTGMKTLAFLAAVSILSAFTVTMVFGPYLLVLLKGKRRDNSNLKHLAMLASGSKSAGWPVLVVVAVVLAGAGYGLRQLQFEGDITKLDAKSDSTKASESLLNEKFGDAISGRTIIVAEGDSLQEALSVTEEFQAHSAMADFRGPTLFLPTIDSQKQNNQAWQKFFDKQRISEIKKMLSNARATNPSSGREIGFSQAQVEGRFSGFLNQLAGDNGHPINATEVIESQGGAVLRQFIIEREGVFYVSSTASQSFAANYFKDAPISNGHVLYKRNLTQRMVALIREDVKYLGFMALLLVTAIVAVKFRNVRMTVAALSPVIGGLVFTLGMMGWLNMPFNIINVMLMVFVAGLGIDYGIFLVASWEGKMAHESAAAGVSVSAITTIIGFGSLTFATHPALFSVGITATIGVSSALLISMLVVPVLLPRKAEDAKAS